MTIDDTLPLHARERPYAGCCAVVADDDLDLRDVLVETLVADGFDVVAVADGAELLLALDLAARGLARFDVVVTDLVMPRVDGFEVLARSSRWADRPPIVLTTAFPDRATEQRARALGAIGPLAKPFDLGDLRTIVWRAVDARRGARRETA